LAFEPDTNSSLGAELGHKDGGFGRLLPGFYRRKEVLVGFDIERVQFDGFELDDDGFVFLGELIREPNPSREIDHDFASTDAFDAEVIELKDR